MKENTDKFKESFVIVKHAEVLKGTTFTFRVRTQ